MQEECRFGDNCFRPDCKFKHKPRSVKKIPCIHFQGKGCLQGDHCPYLHIQKPSQKPNDHKNIPCVHFQGKGCLLGDRCPYSHIIKSPSKGASSAIDSDSPITNIVMQINPIIPSSINLPAKRKTSENVSLDEKFPEDISAYLEMLDRDEDEKIQKISKISPLEEGRNEERAQKIFEETVFDESDVVKEEEGEIGEEVVEKVKGKQSVGEEEMKDSGEKERREEEAEKVVSLEENEVVIEWSRVGKEAARKSEEVEEKVEKDKDGEEKLGNDKENEKDGEIEQRQGKIIETKTGQDGKQLEKEEAHVLNKDVEKENAECGLMEVDKQGKESQLPLEQSLTEEKHQLVHNEPPSESVDFILSPADASLMHIDKPSPIENLSPISKSQEDHSSLVTNPKPKHEEIHIQTAQKSPEVIELKSSGDSQKKPQEVHPKPSEKPKPTEIAIPTSKPADKPVQTPLSKPKPTAEKPTKVAAEAEKTVSISLPRKAASTDKSTRILTLEEIKERKKQEAKKKEEQKEHSQSDTPQVKPSPARDPPAEPKPSQIPSIKSFPKPEQLPKSQIVVLHKSEEKPQTTEATLPVKRKAQPDNTAAEPQKVSKLSKPVEKNFQILVGFEEWEPYRMSLLKLDFDHERFSVEDTEECKKIAKKISTPEGLSEVIYDLEQKLNKYPDPSADPEFDNLSLSEKIEKLYQDSLKI